MITSLALPLLAVLVQIEGMAEGWQAVRRALRILQTEHGTTPQSGPRLGPDAVGRSELALTSPPKGRVTA